MSMRPNDVSGFIADAINVVRDEADALRLSAGAGVAIRNEANALIIDSVVGSNGLARAPMAWDLVRSIEVEGSHCKYAYYIIIGSVVDALGLSLIFDATASEITAERVENVYAQCDNALHEVYRLYVEWDLSAEVERYLCVKCNSRTRKFGFCEREQQYGSPLLETPWQPMPLFPMECWEYKPVARIAAGGVISLGVMTAPQLPDADSLVPIAGENASRSLWRPINRIGSDVEGIVLSEYDTKSAQLQLFVFDCSDEAKYVDSNPPKLYNAIAEGSLSGVYTLPEWLGDWSGLDLIFRRDWRSKGYPFAHVDYVPACSVILVGDADVGAGATIEQIESHQEQLGPRTLRLKSIGDASSSCELDELSDYDIALRRVNGRLETCSGDIVESSLTLTDGNMRYERCKLPKFDADGNQILYAAVGANQYAPIVDIANGIDETGMTDALRAVREMFAEISNASAMIDEINMISENIDGLNTRMGDIETALSGFEARLSALEAL